MEEKNLPSLDENLKGALDIIRLFYTAYMNMPFYQSGSDIVVKVLEELDRALSGLFLRMEQIVFSNLRNKLIVNGQPLSESASKIPFEGPFLEILNRFKIQSLTFKKGLTKAELLKCIRLFVKEPSQGSHFAELFLKEGMSHISVVELSDEGASALGDSAGENQWGQDNAGRASPARQEFAEPLSQKQLKESIDAYISNVVQNIKCEDISDLIISGGDQGIAALIDAGMADEGMLKAQGYFNVFVRRKAIGTVLSHIAKKNGFDSLVPCLLARLEHPQWYIVKNTVELIGDISDVRVADLLEQPLNHHNLKVRRKAIFVLGKIGGTKSIALLNRALENNTGEAQLDIISVLSRIGDNQSLEALEGVSSKEFQAEKAKAVDAIRRRLGVTEKKAAPSDSDGRASSFP